jgi:hypothetical protein
MKAYGVEEVQFHSILTSALDGGEYFLAQCITKLGLYSGGQRTLMLRA